MRDMSLRMIKYVVRCKSIIFVKRLSLFFLSSLSSHVGERKRKRGEEKWNLKYYNSLRTGEKKRVHIQLEEKRKWQSQIKICATSLNSEIARVI